MLVKLLKNERCNNSEACNKWDLLIQTVRAYPHYASRRGPHGVGHQA